MIRLNRGKLISICISLFAPARNDILPEAYAMAVSSKICIASNDLEKLPVRGFIFSALRLQVTGYLGNRDEAFEVAIPREINAPICCLVFCEHQVSSHRTG
jgi:hypothetical protein